MTAPRRLADLGGEWLAAPVRRVRWCKRCDEHEGPAPCATGTGPHWTMHSTSIVGENFSQIASVPKLVGLMLLPS